MHTDNALRKMAIEEVGEWHSLYRISAFASFLLVLYSVAMMLQLSILGGPPNSASEAFRLLQTNRVVGLLRLDLPTVLVMPLYYIVFLGFYRALKWARRVETLVATALAFVGTTLVLATPTALSLVPLSEKYTAATNEAARIQFLAAGEALMAADIWHSTGAMLGGALLQTGAVLICVAMLRGEVFGRPTAYLGITMHGLDLLRIVTIPMLPTSGIVLMAIAGPLYPIWFYLIGRRFLHLSAPITRASAIATGPLVSR